VSEGNDSSTVVATDSQPSTKEIKVCGQQLKGALDLTQKQIKLLESQFPDSMYVFDGDEKPNPLNLDGQITALQLRASRLRVAQLYLNLHVRTTSGQLLCSELCMRDQWASYIARWKTQVGSTSRRRSLYGSEVVVQTQRSTDITVAKRLVPVSVAAENVMRAETEAKRLQDRISAANAVPVKLPDGMLSEEDLVSSPVTNQ
jgi:hypothetical protein